MGVEEHDVVSSSLDPGPNVSSCAERDHQLAVGTVTSLQVQEPHGEVIRVSWVGVQGATAYRVSWRRVDGRALRHIPTLQRDKH